jgi:hypothetical protein
MYRFQGCRSPSLRGARAVLRHNFIDSRPIGEHHARAGEVAFAGVDGERRVYVG